MSLRRAEASDFLPEPSDRMTVVILGDPFAMSTSPLINSFQKAYSEHCFNLIKTLSIKSSIHALLINEGLRDSLTDYEIPSDKTKWKYYLNVSGEYHSSDSLMQVTSLDTREIIIFSKENLEIHVATADAYRYGSREYYSLVNKYPDKENLILGILNPCDINKAVDSEDGTILS